MDMRMFQNKPVSLLGYGCMRFPTQEKDGKRTILRAEAEKLLDCAYAGGVNYYDTAYGYHGGESESFLGEAMKKSPRESFYFATKLPIWMMKDDGPERMEEIFSDQLKRLQTDYIDFYLLHGVDEEGFETVKRLGAYDFIRKKQAEGKVRHVGISFHDTPEVLERILDAYAFDFVQIQLNYLDWTFQGAKEKAELAEEYGIPVWVLKKSDGGFVKLSFPHSDCIAVWTSTGNPDAQFICLEPWTSVPVYEDDAFEDIENKPHAIKLAPEAVYTYSYTVEVG